MVLDFPPDGVGLPPGGVGLPPGGVGLPPDGVGPPPEGLDPLPPTNVPCASTTPAPPELVFLTGLGASLSPPEPPDFDLFNLLIAAENTAPPAKLPAALSVPALSNPKNLRISFSAGIKKPIATTAYMIFTSTSSIAPPTNIIYNSK